MPNRIQEALIVQVPNRKPDHVWIETPDRRLNIRGSALGEHQVQHPKVVAFFIDVSCQVGDANWKRPHYHAVHVTLRLVGGDQQDPQSDAPRTGLG